MTHDEFSKILYSRLQDIEQRLASKAKEYATEDRLHNFKQAAKLKSESPGEALLGMLVKHWVSVMDMTKSFTEDPWFVPTLEQVNEKFGDVICYMILLEALIKERINSGGTN
jgi:hypothetical protein